ncbi:MAG: heavy-metal-associated domain-containing protein [Ferruginibacter sp.]|nr:heavy-metal-associated domain-containing protein [Ferruginibacter sp.]
MKSIQFKTNVMCGACLAKITPAMNEVVGAANWSVDLADPAKVLTVQGDSVEASDIISAVQRAGYTAKEKDAVAS